MPLIDVTDVQLAEQAEQLINHSQLGRGGFSPHSGPDLMHAQVFLAELARRDGNKQARTTNRFTWVVTGLTFIQTVIAVLQVPEIKASLGPLFASLIPMALVVAIVVILSQAMRK
jgi:hypothetical protein